MKQFLSILSICMIYSCGPTALEPAAYVTWVEHVENGLRVSKKVSDFEIEALYTPSAYIVLRENNGRAIDEEHRKERMEQLEQMHYFTLKITSLTGEEMLKTGATSAEEIQRRQQYFTELAQEDLKLVDGGDTMACRLYHFEQNYGLGPFNKMVVAFDKKLKNSTAIQEKTVVFHDRVLGLGKVFLTIDKRTIKNIPNLIH